jgi:zinc transporter ZupT
MAFAGGAMIAVSAVELVPEAFGRKRWKRGAVGSVAGGTLMMGLTLAFGI